MTRNRKPNREKIVPILEDNLKAVQGGLEQHVDNPGQTPMKDDGS